MLPYAKPPVLHLGPLAIDAFSALVCTGILVGIVIARRRCAATGLDPVEGERMVCFAAAVGLITSHVGDVLAYHASWVREDPLVLLRVWGSHSSFAGILGGFLGVALYAPRRWDALNARVRLAYVDAFTYAFVFVWIFGRLGCTLVLDHPGRVTSFPLATSLATPEARAILHAAYADAGRLAELPSDAVLARLGMHNLGFYEWLYTVLVLVPATVVLGRRRRAPGFGIASFLLMYAPIRFVADFFRVGEQSYAGLTFGQYAALALTLAAAWLVRTTWRTSDTNGARSGVIS